MQLTNRRESSYQPQNNHQISDLGSGGLTGDYTSILYFHTVPWYTCYTLKSTFITSLPSASSQRSYTATPYTRTSASCTLSRTIAGTTRVGHTNSFSNSGGASSGSRATTTIVADITYNRTKPHIIRFAHHDGEMEEIVMKRCGFMKLRGRKKFEYHGKIYIWRQIKNWQAGNDLVLCEIGKSSSSQDYGTQNNDNDDDDRLRNDEEVLSDDDAEQEDLSSIPSNTIVATFKRDKQNKSSTVDSTRRVLEVNTERVDEVMVVATALVMWQGIRIKKRVQARLLYAAGSG